MGNATHCALLRVLEGAFGFWKFSGAYRSLWRAGCGQRVGRLMADGGTEGMREFRRGKSGSLARYARVRCGRDNDLVGVEQMAPVVFAGLRLEPRGRGPRVHD